HPGQADRGATMDRPRGVRWTTTVRNEPNSSPPSANPPERSTCVMSTVATPAVLLSVDDLAEVRDLDGVPGLGPAREEDRRVVEGHLVVDVHRAPEDLPELGVLV